MAKKKKYSDKLSRFEAHRISDEEAGTIRGGALFSSYPGFLYLKRSFWETEPDRELEVYIKHDLKIMNSCVSFSGLKPGKDYGFVITQSGELRIGDLTPGIHYLLAEGSKSVKAAGILKINALGKIMEVLNNSGHYRPLPVDNDQVFEAFGQCGLLAPGARKINLEFLEHPTAS